MKKEYPRLTESYSSPIRLILEMKHCYKNSGKKQFAPFAAQRDGLGRLFKSKEKLNLPIDLGKKVKSHQNTEPISSQRNQSERFPLDTEKSDHVDNQILHSFQFNNPREMKGVSSSRLTYKKKVLTSITNDQEPISKDALSHSVSAKRQRFSSVDLTKENCFSSKIRSNTTNTTNTTKIPNKVSPKLVCDDNNTKMLQSKARTDRSGIALRKLSESLSKTPDFLPLMKGKPKQIGTSLIPTQRKWPKLNNNIQERNEIFKKKMLDLKEKAFIMKFQNQDQ